MISKLNTGNIYDGCLSELRNEIQGVIREDQKWYSGYDLKYIIGTEEPYNVVPTPYNDPPSYIKIYFGNHFIQPVSYSLMGRRITEHNDAYLKAWNFLGQTIKDEWILLDFHEDWQFDFAEIRTFVLNSKESFKGFMINMTSQNSNNKWGIALGQIEVHGYIFNRYRIYDPNLMTFKCFKLASCLLFSCIPGFC